MKRGVSKYEHNVCRNDTNGKIKSLHDNLYEKNYISKYGHNVCTNDTSDKCK